MNLSADDNTSTNTVNQLIKCLARYFLYLECIITQWQGSPLISDELHNYLLSYNVATSQSTPYNPRGNGQVEHYNDIISNTVNLALNLHDKQDELVLSDVLHSIRTLLCTSTNATPHKRFFKFQRKSTTGQAVSAWLSKPGKIFVKIHVRKS